MTASRCEFPGCSNWGHHYHWFFKKNHCSNHSPHKCIWPGKKFHHAIIGETNEKRRKKMIARKGFGKRYFE
jgi:hypothetical protein